MHKKITTFQLTMTTLSGMIGVGWLFGSHIGAMQAGYGALISWLIAGALAMSIALIFCEMTVAIPLTGSYLRYPHLTHGNLPSFVMSWLPWLSCVLAAPTEVNAILLYSSRFAPWLSVADQLTTSGIMVAVGLMVVCTYANMKGINILLNYTKYLTLWKIAIPLLTLLLFSLHATPSSQTSYLWTTQGWQGVFEFASGMCFFSFLGFLEATTFAGELECPKRSVPIAILGSIAFCTLLYVLMQWVFLKHIPAHWIASGWEHLSFSGDSGPFAAIAVFLGLHQLAHLIYLDAIITPSGTAMVYTASTARMVVAMSENGQLPKHYGQLNHAGMPHVALLINALFGIILLLSLKNFDQLIRFQSSAMMLAYSMGPVSFLAFRERVPDLPRPFSVPYPRLLAWIVFSFCNLTIYCSGWYINRLLFAILYVAGALYASQSVGADSMPWRSQPWIITHWVFLATLSCFGSYAGGMGWIGPGYDFALIAVGSWFILNQSIRYARDGKSISQALSTVHTA